MNVQPECPIPSKNLSDLHRSRTPEMISSAKALKQSFKIFANYYELIKTLPYYKCTNIFLVKRHMIRGEKESFKSGCLESLEMKINISVGTAL